MTVEAFHSGNPRTRINELKPPPKDFINSLTKTSISTPNMEDIKASIHFFLNTIPFSNPMGCWFTTHGEEHHLVNLQHHFQKHLHDIGGLLPPFLSCYICQTEQVVHLITNILWLNDVMLNISFGASHAAFCPWAYSMSFNTAESDHE